MTGLPLAPSIKILAQDGGTVPVLAGGLLNPSGEPILIPKRHAEALAAWAAQHDVNEHATIVCSAVPMANHGPGFSYHAPRDMRLSPNEKRELGQIGWELDLFDEKAQTSVVMLDDGSVRELHRRELPESRRLGGKNGWYETLDDAAARVSRMQRELLTAELTQDATIRAALAQGVIRRALEDEPGLPHTYIAAIAAREQPDGLQ